uniref:TSA: Wollemia nobilis Ref_Wollemi_Transcript_2437_1707 transcribed RNA sequence n=1 Tax=Wollemia nobilis TaxID=56998 RepID=A0A0C9SAM5_9CONI
MNWCRLPLIRLNKINKNKNKNTITISRNPMADRYFPNTMPHYVEEEPIESQAKDGEDRLLYLLRLPYASAANKFLEAALSLKDEIVRETWINTQGTVRDFSVYTGSLGIAYLCFKAYEVTKNKDDLSLCTQIVESCANAARGMREYVTFICGQAGVYALGAAAAKCNENQQSLEHYLSLFKKIPKRFESYDVPYELLYGRAGFLWAAAFVNKYVGTETIPTSITGRVVDDILRAGKSLTHKYCPLMYEWHGKKILGGSPWFGRDYACLNAFSIKQRS